ncbi:MAG: TonB family protein [Bdellovibrionales bacterium]|nr:TonB family protein [Bdellovibrionales bacterium]
MKTSIAASFFASALIHGILYFSLFLHKNIPQATYTEISIQHLPSVKSSKKATSQQRSTRKSFLKESKLEGDSLTHPQNFAPIYGKSLGIVANYPRLSRTLGEVGKVLVQIKYFSDKPMTFKVIESSGYSRLDQSAVLAAREAAKNENLIKYLLTKNQIELAFEFRLK